MRFPEYCSDNKIVLLSVFQKDVVFDFINMEIAKRILS